jgi:hypothetical protein
MAQKWGSQGAAMQDMVVQVILLEHAPLAHLSTIQQNKSTF